MKHSFFLIQCIITILGVHQGLMAQLQPGTPEAALLDAGNEQTLILQSKSTSNGGNNETGIIFRNAGQQSRYMWNFRKGSGDHFYIRGKQFFDGGGVLQDGPVYFSINNTKNDDSNMAENLEGLVTIPNSLYIGEDGYGKISLANDLRHKFRLWVETGIWGVDYAISALAAVQADYVFDEDYELSSLTELEAYLKANKHLPDVPSVGDIKEAGYLSLKDQTIGTLKNLEEQVLHNIAQEKKIKAQEEKITSQEKMIQSLVKRIEKLEADQDIE